MNELQEPGRVAMSRRERDVLVVMRRVASGELTQADAARVLKKSVRQIRRLQRKMEADGDAALVPDLGPVLGSHALLLLADVGPQLVDLDGINPQVPEEPVVDLMTAFADAKAEAHHRVPVDAGQTACRPDATAFGEQFDNFDLFFNWQNMHRQWMGCSQDCRLHEIVDKEPVNAYAACIGQFPRLQSGEVDLRGAEVVCATSDPSVYGNSYSVVMATLLE